MNKENDLVRTYTIEMLNQCKRAIIDCIGTPRYLDMYYYINKTRKQLELYDKEMGYE